MGCARTASAPLSIALRAPNLAIQFASLSVPIIKCASNVLKTSMDLVLCNMPVDTGSGGSSSSDGLDRGARRGELQLHAKNQLHYLWRQRNALFIADQLYEVLWKETSFIDLRF